VTLLEFFDFSARRNRYASSYGSEPPPICAAGARLRAAMRPRHIVNNNVKEQRIDRSFSAAVSTECFARNSHLTGSGQAIVEQSFDPPKYS